MSDSTYDGNERCDFPGCPGYEPSDEGWLRRDDGAFHEECHSAWVDEQARFFAGAMRDDRRPVRAVEAVDDFLDELMHRGDDLRTAERDS